MSFRKLFLIFSGLLICSCASQSLFVGESYRFKNSPIKFEIEKNEESAKSMQESIQTRFFKALSPRFPNRLIVKIGFETEAAPGTNRLKSRNQYLLDLRQEYSIPYSQAISKTLTCQSKYNEIIDYDPTRSRLIYSVQTNERLNINLCLPIQNYFQQYVFAKFDSKSLTWIEVTLYQDLKNVSISLNSFVSEVEEQAQSYFRKASK